MHIEEQAHRGGSDAQRKLALTNAGFYGTAKFVSIADIHCDL